MALQKEIVCPHCWFTFPPHETKWLARHPVLHDDQKIQDAPRRFLPTMYDVYGNAIDPKGEVCTKIACPKCHLEIPRDVIELPSTLFSILGSPSSGKSYFLAASLWRLRTTLFKYFRASIEDADPAANRKVHEYEETLFLNSDHTKLVALPKTELDGDLYNSVELEPGRVVTLPHPFVFRLRLLPEHKNYGQIRRNGRCFTLYDNAGEHFMPDRDTANAPGTQHLAVSKAMMFVFDPTQHHAVRERLKDVAHDPQIDSQARSTRQDQILTEAAKRIRQDVGLAPDERDKRPLIVVLTKYDAWSHLAGDKELQLSWVLKNEGDSYGLDLAALHNVSTLFRKMLVELCPEIVAAADAFSEDVTYIPVSALGCSPTRMPDGVLGVNPGSIHPSWAEVPLLYAMHRCIPGFVDKLQTVDPVATT